MFAEQSTWDIESPPMIEPEIHAPFFAGPEETDVACLLIHGFMSTPLEMHGLAEALADQGIRVYAMAVAGHTGNPEDALRVDYKAWIASAETGLAQLLSYPYVFVAGLSMGGALALLLASRHSDRITGVVAMSTFARLSPATWQRHLLHLLPIARFFVKWFYPLSSSDFQNSSFQEEFMDHLRLKYPQATLDFSDPRTVAVIKKERIPVHAIEELVHLISEERKQLHLVHSPLLIIHSKQDQTARPACADELYRLATAATPKSIYWLNRSHHAIPLGPQREEVYRIVFEFIQDTARQSGLISSFSTT